MSPKWDLHHHHIELFSLFSFIIFIVIKVLSFYTFGSTQYYTARVFFSYRNVSHHLQHNKVKIENIKNILKK